MKTRASFQQWQRRIRLGASPPPPSCRHPTGINLGCRLVLKANFTKMAVYLFIYCTGGYHRSLQKVPSTYRCLYREAWIKLVDKSGGRKKWSRFKNVWEILTAWLFWPNFLSKTFLHIQEVRPVCRGGGALLGRLLLVVGHRSSGGGSGETSAVGQPGGGPAPARTGRRTGRPRPPPTGASAPPLRWQRPLRPSSQHRHPLGINQAGGPRLAPRHDL